MVLSGLITFLSPIFLPILEINIFNSYLHEVAYFRPYSYELLGRSNGDFPITGWTFLGIPGIILLLIFCFLGLFKVLRAEVLQKDERTYSFLLVGLFELVLLMLVLLGDCTNFHSFGLSGTCVKSGIGFGFGFLLLVGSAVVTISIGYNKIKISISNRKRKLNLSYKEKMAFQ